LSGLESGLKDVEWRLGDALRLRAEPAGRIRADGAQAFSGARRKRRELSW